MHNTARSEPTVTSLLAAARTLFLERNYADVTMDQIVARCEVTKGALYYHFASKEELYLAMLHRDLAEKRELFLQAVHAEGTARDRLRHLTELFLRLPREKRELIQLVRRDINVFEGDTRAELVRAYQAALPQQIATILGDGIAAGELAPADTRLLSWDYIALVEVGLTAYADTIFQTNEQKLDHILATFFDGVATDQPGEPE